MSKIKIKSTISKNNENISKIMVEALKSDNKIIFYDENNTLMKVEIDGAMVVITRSNEDMKLLMSFEKNKSLNSFCEIKTLNSKIDVKTITKDLIISSNSLKIIYDMYMDDEYSGTFNYKLEWRD